eukprot:4614385-Heterocapsa_arctica.AAC.1
MLAAPKRSTADGSLSAVRYRPACGRIAVRRYAQTLGLQKVSTRNETAQDRPELGPLNFD